MVIKRLSDRHKHGQMVIEFVSQHRQGQLVIEFVNEQNWGQMVISSLVNGVLNLSANAKRSSNSSTGRSGAAKWSSNV
jgi:hypothetical protein